VRKPHIQEIVVFYDNDVLDGSYLLEATPVCWRWDKCCRTICHLSGTCLLVFLWLII